MVEKRAVNDQGWDAITVGDFKDRRILFIGNDKAYGDLRVMFKMLDYFFCI